MTAWQINATSNVIPLSLRRGSRRINIPTILQLDDLTKMILMKGSIDFLALKKAKEMKTAMYKLGHI